MKSKRNILIAFLLNFSFSIFEFFGGILTNSIAIISDSVHDMGDSLSIGISYLLERQSSKKPDEKYTYGYVRYSVLGSVITTIILIIGSFFVIYSAVKRIFNPATINYDGMLLFAIVGILVNFFAAYFTKDGKSLNQKSVNLHMIEDVLGWVVVLFGAIIMKFTNISLIDAILSIVVAIYIFSNALKNLKAILDMFLEKIPDNLSLEKIKKELLTIKNVHDVHHIHIWSLDGYNNYATLHVVINKEDKKVKSQIREKLLDFNIVHVTIEIELEDEKCAEENCQYVTSDSHSHHHH